MALTSGLEGIGALASVTWNGYNRDSAGHVVAVSGHLHLRKRSWRSTAAPRPSRPAWHPATAYSGGAYRAPSEANEHVYMVATAGTSGAYEPTWPLTAGKTVQDGTVVWQEAGASSGTYAGLTAFTDGDLELTNLDTVALVYEVSIGSTVVVPMTTLAVGASAVHNLASLAASNGLAWPQLWYTRHGVA